MQKELNKKCCNKTENLIGANIMQCQSGV